MKTYETNFIITKVLTLAVHYTFLDHLKAFRNCTAHERNFCTDSANPDRTGLTFAGHYAVYFLPVQRVGNLLATDIIQADRQSQINIALR